MISKQLPIVPRNTQPTIIPELLSRYPDVIHSGVADDVDGGWRTMSDVGELMRGKPNSGVTSLEIRAPG